MKPLSDFYPIGMTCPNCGWGWTTTYIESILSDSTDYHVFLVSGDNSLTEIKAISEIDNCNYVETKKMIENVPVEVKAIKEKLVAAGVDFRIKPEFPY